MAPNLAQAQRNTIRDMIVNGSMTNGQLVAAVAPSWPCVRSIFALVALKHPATVADALAPLLVLCVMLYVVSVICII